MIQVVVAVGLVAVLATYVRCGLLDPTLLGHAAFWLRWVLLVITIAFTSYHLLAYSADMVSLAGATGWGHKKCGPSGIIVLFLLDLACLGAMAAMYGALRVSAGTSAKQFAVSWCAMAWLAAMASVYHGVQILWHRVAGSGWTALAAHLAFALAFGGLAFFAVFQKSMMPLSIPGSVVQGMWTATFGLVVLILYFSRGRLIIRDALAGI